jgi:hypothetical protein
MKYYWTTIIFSFYFCAIAVAQNVTAMSNPAATLTANSSLLVANQTSSIANSDKQPQTEKNQPVDILTLSSFIVAGLTLITTVIVIIGGFTLYKSAADANQAKLESERTMNELRVNMANFNETVQKEIQVIGEKKAAFTKMLESELELFRRNLHEASTIRTAKIELTELLAEEKPNIDLVYPLLTEILEYPDQTSFKIYEDLLTAFPNDKDIIKKVKTGLQIFRERNYNPVPQSKPHADC